MNVIICTCFPNTPIKRRAWFSWRPWFKHTLQEHDPRVNVLFIASRSPWGFHWFCFHIIFWGVENTNISWHFEYTWYSSWTSEMRSFESSCWLWRKAHLSYTRLQLLRHHARVAACAPVNMEAGSCFNLEAIFPGIDIPIIKMGQLQPHCW